MENTQNELQEEESIAEAADSGDTEKKAEDLENTEDSEFERPRRKRKRKNKKDRTQKKNSKKNRKNKKKRKILIRIGTVLAVFMATLSVLVHFSKNWVFSTWNGLKMDEVIFHMKAPLTGTGAGMIEDYIRTGVVPAVITLAVSVLIFVILRKRRKIYVPVMSAVLIVSIVLTTISVRDFWTELDIGSYIRNRFDTSTFIEDNYADPAEVSVTFPEQKRNLIHIFLESMETTYSDAQDGGAFRDNYIPELTALAQENEDFSGNRQPLNGGRVFTGSTYTMAGIFTQTAGLPLQVNLSDNFTDTRGSFNNMDTQESFFSGVTALGDLLEEQGYNQTFLLGSDVTFGGRQLYFTDHGKFEFRDYNYALENEWIASNYKVWWGYEDEKLFSFAKETLAELSAQEKPFNLTMLTVDTHFEDGYVCELCGDEFAGNQYANVMACSSRQVAAFIEWCKTQEWYENTTIVLTGDHLTMDKDFCQNVDEAVYDRKTYTCYINAAVKPEDPNRTREYSTLDTYPTIVAALGAKIEGDRLGLGTNLFSTEDTLLEQYGYEYMEEELQKRSEFMDSLSDLNLYSEDLLKQKGLAPTGTVEVTSASADSGTLVIRLSKIKNVYEEVGSINAKITDLDDPSKTVTVQLEKAKSTTAEDEEEELGKAVYTSRVNVSSLNIRAANLTLTLIGESGKEYNLGHLEGDLTLKTRNIYNYLRTLNNNRQYDIFIGVKDEASRSLSIAIVELMQDLGLEFDLMGHYRYGYYAILPSDGDALEDMSVDPLSISGTLPDGTQYDIISQGGYNGKYNSCSIKINGEDYALNKIGLNFVIYDRENARVVDAVQFNTYAGLGANRYEDSQ